jgi:NitT/TauT family transport system substrate-binding protein
MSTPIGGPGGGPSKDGPSGNAPKNVRHTEFVGDVAIAELRSKLARSPDLIPEPPPTSAGRKKYLLAGWLAGAAMVTAVGFVGYRLRSAPPPDTPLHALPAGQSRQSALPQSALPTVTLTPVEQSRDIAPPRAASLTVGAVRPLAADEAATLTVSAKDAGPNAVVMIGGLAAGSALSAGTQQGPGTWQLSAERLDRAVITPPRGFAGAMDLTLELRLANGTVADRKSLPLEWADRGGSAPAKPEPKPELRQHDPSEVAAMMRSAGELMASGDVSGARLMYLRLAKEGEASAALALAESYDPSLLRKSSATRSVAPDVALAQSWYEKAKALGSPVAAERLEAMVRLDKVTLVTDFGYSGRHAHFFEAVDRGYYRDAGLEVKITRGQGSADAIRQIDAGLAMFGFVDAGTLVLARANDHSAVKLVAAIYRKPPQAVFCREDSGLKRPKDLEGNAIADTAGASIPALFPAFAKAAGFDAQTVRWVHANIESLPGLLATDKVPCVGQFTLGEALLQSRLGSAKLVRFAYADAGLNYYGNGIVASAATIASKPDIVRRFVEASIRGMKDAFADPAAAGAIMQKIVPQMDATIAKKETEAAAELAQIPGQPLGEIDPARIEATIDVVKGAFRLATPVAAADLYAPGFVPK